MKPDQEVVDSLKAFVKACEKFVKKEKQFTRFQKIVALACIQILRYVIKMK